MGERQGVDRGHVATGRSGWAKEDEEEEEEEDGEGEELKEGKDGETRGW